MPRSFSVANIEAAFLSVVGNNGYQRHVFPKRLSDARCPFEAFFPTARIGPSTISVLLEVPVGGFDQLVRFLQRRDIR